MNDMANATEVDDLDSFAAAFERITDQDAGNPPQEPPQEAPAAEAPQASESNDETTEAVQEDTEEDAAPEAEDAGAAEESSTQAPTASQNDASLARLLELLDQKSAQSAAPPPPQETYQAAPEPEIYSEEDKQFLAEYEKDWPDVAKAEALRRRSEYRDLVKYVFNEVANELRPLSEMVRSMSERTHLDDLYTNVGDYDQVRDKVVDWVGTQPPYLQAAYNHVIQNGTVDEVVDLINRYRQATGDSLTQQAAPQAAPRKVDTELPSATKQAAASLAPVSSKRSAVIQADDPNDFESAFASFAGKL
jgi:hypothetical protein